MNKFLNLRTVPGVMFVLTMLALGTSGSARVSHLRSDQQRGPGKLAFWVRDANRTLPDGEYFPIKDATIEATDERGECPRSFVSTGQTGYAYVLCRYGKVDIKISATGYEDYAEDGYEFTEEETKEVLLKKSSQ